MRLRHPLLLALAPLAFVLAGADPAFASLRDHKTLVFEGRTVDPEGFPIERVRLRLSGSRRATATSNADGQFSLRIPLGTPNDLRHGPIHLTLVAERGGYRFAMPGGDETLGLELGLEVASPGLGRCVARSNDDRVAASAARIVALEGDAVGLVVVNFLGVKGEASRAGMEPKLTQVAQVALAFPLEGRVSALSSSPDTVGQVEKASKRPKASSWSILDEGRGARRTRQPDRPRGSVPRTSEERLAQAHAADSGRAAPPDTTDDRWRDARWHSSELPSQAAKPAGVMPTGRKEPERVIDGSPRASGEAAGRPTIERPAPPAALPSPSPSPSPPSGPVIIPDPGVPWGRARSRPLVIRNPPPGSRSRSDSCQCRIEGTVEVQTVVPIRNRQKIEVSLQWYPQLRDTVELFMGPPRPFKLPIAPCGPQRLRLRVLSDGRFDVASREAMAGFRCDGGRLYQPRIVLVTH